MWKFFRFLCDIYTLIRIFPVRTGHSLKYIFVLWLMFKICFWFLTKKDGLWKCKNDKNYFILFVVYDFHMSDYLITQCKCSIIYETFALCNKIFRHVKNSISYETGRNHTEKCLNLVSVAKLFTILLMTSEIYEIQCEWDLKKLLPFLKCTFKLNVCKFQSLINDSEVHFFICFGQALFKDLIGFECDDSMLFKCSYIWKIHLYIVVILSLNSENKTKQNVDAYEQKLIKNYKNV